MRKSHQICTEKVHFSLYCVDDTYGVIAATAHGLFESTLPAFASQEDVLATIRQRYTRPCGENSLTRDAAQKLFRYFSGECIEFDFPIETQRFTAFQRLVYQSVAAIRYGTVKTYGEIAREIQQPGSARGVGSAMAVIPCRSLYPAIG